MPLTIRETLKAEVLVLNLEGRLDVGTSPALEKRLHEAFDGGGRRLVLDLAGLEYVSSAGLRVLLAALDRLEKAEGRMVLSGTQGYVLEVFDVAGLVTVFPMVPTLEEAEARAAAP